jgi:hypothetical protein
MRKVNDRGTIKWTSLMLPEQQQILQEMWAEQSKKEKPILDKQELELLDKKLQLAIHQDIPVSITYFSDGEYEVKKGKLKQVNGLEKYLEFDDSTKIKLEDVLDVDPAD